jgi:serpin B
MKRLMIFSVITIFIAAGCETSTQISDNIPVRELTQAEKQIASSADDFAFKVFKKISENEPYTNVFVSPLSISMALGMTLNGAAGETYDAMRNTLSLSGLTQDEINESYKSLVELLTSIDQQVIMQIANSIWYRNDIQVGQVFINTNKKYFNAVINPMNFDDPGTVNVINAWVKTSTNGKIEKIVERIERETIMFLINAIYFKGNWKHQFDKTKTRDDFFTKLSGSPVPCKMMNQENDFMFISNEIFSMIDLPYGNGIFSMTIILPKDNRSIKDALNFITKENLNSLIANLAKAKKKLYMPKFKLEYKINLNETLKALGMGIAFDGGRANFTKLYEGPGNAFISNVEHKTYVDVNEEGTEAAAVTSVEVGRTSIDDSIIRLDRPFIFMIREKNSNCILFIGKMEDPSAQ